MDGKEHKWRLAPIRWFTPLPPGRKLAPADAAVHFDPAKFRKIPGQLPLTPITTEETSSEDDH